MFKKFLLTLIIVLTAISSPAFASAANDMFVTAIENRDLKTVEGMLLANNDNTLLTGRDRYGRTPLHYAAAQGDIRILSALLAKSPDVNAKDDNNQTPLFYAVDKSYEDNTRMLITSGANVNITNDTRFTPLMIASQKGKPKLAKLLIAAGADVNAQSASGATPLLYAAARGNRDLVRALLKNNAKLRARDKLGNTAMHYAAQKNRRKVIAELLPLINKRNNDGKTPLDVATMAGNRDFASQLLQSGAKTGK